MPLSIWTEVGKMSEMVALQLKDRDDGNAVTTQRGTVASRLSSVAFCLMKQSKFAASGDPRMTPSECQ